MLQLDTLYVTAMIYHKFISFSPVQIYDLSYIHLQYSYVLCLFQEQVSHLKGMFIARLVKPMYSTTS